MAELSKTYEPKEVETKWYQRWVESGCFEGDVSAGNEAFSIVIPPPNVTGILHLGHVLNNTIQDILCRRARSEGKDVLWLPGTDHAGIATQVKVEKQLKKETGQTRRDVGREAFLEKVWEWKEKHGGIIVEQLKRLGCSCDWSRERFTMDVEYSRWVSKVFSDLFEEGLIYRGRRMVNWCPVSLTALSDEEVIMKAQKSKLYTMKYELVDEPGTFLEIATTRPETLMGDTGVAVNPKDPRYGHLVGSKIRRPFPEAELPIVADEHIDIEFGTGVLKVTPAHDKADFEIGERHGLPAIDVLTPQGKINCPEVPELHGLDRFEARVKAVEMLEEMGQLVREEDYENNVGFSERADVPIEPRLSMQWFLKYPSVREATEAVASGEIAFRPERWQKTYLHWMENIQDWCISRQLWWGHRIPVWYRKEDAVALQDRELSKADVATGDLHVGIEGPADPENWVQDEDVLDTWFSSWLWPFATMTDVGEESELVKKFYPTCDLATGPDIIFFWVARMIMAGYHFRGEKPFSNVYFNSIIRDLKGRKMSKQLGNSPDPLDLMDAYGADALRFGLLRIAPTGTDVKFDEKSVEMGRNFATKLWNAARYRLMHGEAGVSWEEARGRLGAFDVDVLAKLDGLGASISSAYVDYKFNDLAAQIYEFFWSNFCDLYLEAIKNDLREGSDAERKAVVLAVMDQVFGRFLQILHPFMPHITEELWETMELGEGYLVNRAQPTEAVLSGVDGDRIESAKVEAGRTYEAAARVRNLKAEYQLASKKDVPLILKPAGEVSESVLSVLKLLAGAGEVTLDASYAPASGTPSVLTDLGEVSMPLDGLIDVEAEKKRLSAEVAKVVKEVEKCEKKLANEKFVANAKPEVVAKERERLAEWAGKKEQLEGMLGNL